jgi:hypothetical protein
VPTAPARELVVDDEFTVAGLAGRVRLLTNRVPA